MADKERIAEFFQGKPVKYEAKVGSIQVDLTLQHQTPTGWKYGTDRLCYADLNIQFLLSRIGYANRNPSLTWKPAYLHVDSRNPLYFAGLFEQMHNMAADFSNMLTHGSSTPSVHGLRRAFDALEDKFKEDFGCEEFNKYFETDAVPGCSILGPIHIQR